MRILQNHGFLNPPCLGPENQDVEFTWPVGPLVLVVLLRVLSGFCQEEGM